MIDSLTTPPTSSSIQLGTPKTPSEWAGATGLLLDYFAWLAPLAGVPSVPEVQASARAELDDLAAAYRPRGHRLLLATQGRLPVGIVGLRPTESPDRDRRDRDRVGGGTVELVRFYSRPAARGAGVGTTLLVAALDSATELGYRRVVLDTVPDFMPEAVRLYQRHGFAPSPEPHGLPVDSGLRFELTLVSRAGGTGPGTEV